MLDEVAKEIRGRAKIHLFGLARIGPLPQFASYGVTSIDSASFLRRAWLGARDNYHTPVSHYCAIRIPEVGASFRAKRAVAAKGIPVPQAVASEQAALATVRAYDRGKASLDSALNAVMVYERLIGDEKTHTVEDMRRTLEDMPWKDCPCAICRDAGVEVVIFRGNNRNRRRGFHNTFVFYRLVSDVFDGRPLHSREGPETTASWNSCKWERSSPWQRGTSHRGLP